MVISVCRIKREQTERGCMNGQHRQTARKIVECRMTVEDVAKAVGINTAILYRRLSGGGGTFTIDEADKIASLLELNADELNKIFFAQNVA